MSWVCAVFALASAFAGAPAAPKLDGAFIQYSPATARLTAEDWRAEMDAFHEAGLRILVLQWLKAGERRYIPDEPGGVDATEIILAYADAHDIQVFVGLAHDDGWWAGWSDPAYLDRTAAENIRAAEQAWGRYRGHASFAGWYIPQELWDEHTDQQLDLLRGFLRKVSARCNELAPGKPVSIAPFFAGTVPPERLRAAYTRLLDDAGIDILMLQDGVGARAWDDRVEEAVTPYFRAMKAACDATQVRLWADLECFTKVGERGFAPAHVDRLRRQLAAEAPFVERIVAFDFFHYLSPRRGERQKLLYDSLQ